MISVIDSVENIKKATVAVERMLTDGLLVVTDVRAIRITQRAVPSEQADV